MFQSFRSRLAGTCFLAALAAGLPAGFAQPVRPSAFPAPAPVPLDEVVISASRSLQDRRHTPSAVSLVPLDELQMAQIGELRSALAREPGINAISTGPAGGQTSVFLRGASSHQTLFVVDGVRMNDRAASYTNFLGAADLVGIDRLEILRGPQSTLYGSSALGGVILMEMAPASGPVDAQVSALAGSFDTWGAAVAGQGRAKRVGVTASAGRFVTGNDLPDNGLRQWSYAARMDAAATDTVAFGATFRGVNAEYEETGSRLFPSPGEVRSDNYLGTVFTQAQLAPTLQSKVTLAQHERRYRFTAPWGVSEQRNRRRIVDWLNTWSPREEWEVVAGANYERSRYLVDGAPTEDEVLAGHLSTTVRLAEDVILTGGVRHDDFESFGAATTWRTGASWLLSAATKLRATYGTGFSAPGSDDRYGVPAWGQLPNPDLVAEESRGWDVGIDHQFDAAGRYTVAATYFQNRFRNLFEWELVDPTTFQGQIVNRSRARTEGVELAVVARPVERVQLRVAYTYLEAEDDTSGQRLIRRPRHVVDAEVRVQPAASWTLGAGAHGVADRLDVEGAMPDYVTARVFAAYQVTPALTLRARVENVFDESYEEVFGYPALPRGGFGSIEWQF